MSEYNGWSNYETWLVALHIGNEQETHERAREMAREALEGAGEDFGVPKGPGCAPESLRAVHILADMLRDWADEELAPQNSDNILVNDLIRSALDEVNWGEIAESYMDEATREAEEDVVAAAEYAVEEGQARWSETGSTRKE